MHDERIIHYRNTSEEVIPQFGIIQTAGVVGVKYDENELVLAGTKTATDNGDSRHGISVGRVVAGGKGAVVFPHHKPFWVLYDEGDSSDPLTPIEGETWGIKSGSYKLTKDYRGFIVIGQATNGRVLVVLESATPSSATLAKWGKLNNDYGPWETASVTVWVGNPGQMGGDGEESAEVTISAHMPGISLPFEARVHLIPTNGLSSLNPGEPGYQIVPLECPGDPESSSGL